MLIQTSSSSHVDHRPAIVLYMDHPGDPIPESLHELYQVFQQFCLKDIPTTYTQPISCMCFFLKTISPDVFDFLEYRKYHPSFKNIPVLLGSQDSSVVSAYAQASIDDFYVGQLHDQLFSTRLHKVLQDSIRWNSGIAPSMPLELAFMAYYDSLTGLANRHRFEHFLRERTEHEKHFFSPLASAIMYIDLDGFKAINDCWGHERGDWLLNQVGYRLKHCLKRTDLIARMGGDEFGVFLNDVPCAMTLRRIAQRVLTYIGAPYHWKSVILKVSASIGIARYPNATQDYFVLLQNADRAMYEVKNCGKNNIHFYT